MSESAIASRFKSFLLETSSSRFPAQEKLYIQLPITLSPSSTLLAFRRQQQRVVSIFIFIIKLRAENRWKTGDVKGKGHPTARFPKIPNLTVERRWQYFPACALRPRALHTPHGAYKSRLRRPGNNQPSPPSDSHRLQISLRCTPFLHLLLPR